MLQSPPALSSGGIAQGAQFSIFGSNLGPANSPALSFPLSTTLAAVSISVTQGTTVVAAIPVFLSPGQIRPSRPLLPTRHLQQFQEQQRSRQRREIRLRNLHLHRHRTRSSDSAPPSDPITSPPLPAISPPQSRYSSEASPPPLLTPAAPPVAPHRSNRLHRPPRRSLRMLGARRRPHPRDDRLQHRHHGHRPELQLLRTQ